MKKWLIALLFTCFIAFGFSLQTFAATDSVVDDAGLFTPEQIVRLNEQITPLAEKSKADVFIVTTDYNDRNSARDYADYYILEHVGRNKNAILFLFDMDNREIYISTSGNMIDYMDDRRVDDTLDLAYESMTSSNYYGAAEAFLTKTDAYFEKGVPGGHYRVDEETGKITRYKSLTTTEIVIALVVAVVLSLVFLGITISKYQLKFGTYKYPFREKSALNLTSRTDQLTNSFVTTRRIPRNNNSGGGGMGGGGSSTHSTGGGSFGGGGRSF